MGFDSTAELLFKINANADDAQGNIQRFRGMMSKDFSAMGAEAEDWAKKTFGALNSIQGLATAGAASMAAGVVAAAAKMHEATDQYAEYVGEVAKSESHRCCRGGDIQAPVRGENDRNGLGRADKGTGSLRVAGAQRRVAPTIRALRLRSSGFRRRMCRLERRKCCPSSCK